MIRFKKWKDLLHSGPPQWLCNVHFITSKSFWMTKLFRHFILLCIVQCHHLLMRRDEINNFFSCDFLFICMRWSAETFLQSAKIRTIYDVENCVKKSVSICLHLIKCGVCNQLKLISDKCAKCQAACNIANDLHDNFSVGVVFWKRQQNEKSKEQII